MRLVLDTNVVVSALLWGGPPFALLQAATDGEVVLFTSPVLRAELRAVLARPHLAARLRRYRGTVADAVALYGALAVTVTPGAVPRVVPGDPDDDHIIAAAVAARAELIVSGDRHLLALGQHQGIAIRAPASAVALIGR